ncbi:hypothetical protein NHU87_26020 [Pseudomonas mandelii]|nr:hypothetical protein [Pseudomonas mandelii]MCO8314102.1 hypothetical protein [Pseudomonas mandelii]
MQPVEHTANQAKIAFGNVPVHPRPLQGGFQGGLLAGIDFQPQGRCGGRIGKTKRVFEIACVLRADVQFTTEFRKGRDAQLLLDERQGVELAGRGRLCNESRSRFEGGVFGFLFFEIVQRCVEQRHRPGAGAGLDCKPGDRHGNVQAQKGCPDIEIQIEAALQRSFKDRRGEGAGVLQVFQAFIDFTLRSPVRGIKRLQFLVVCRGRGLKSGRKLRLSVLQRLAPGRRDIAQPVGNCVFEV